MNDGDETCRFLQIWLTPDRRGHAPQYGSTRYERADRHNRLLRILGGTGPAPAWPQLHSPHSISLHQVGGWRVWLGGWVGAHLVCATGAGWACAGLWRAPRVGPTGALRC